MFQVRFRDNSKIDEWLPPHNMQRDLIHNFLVNQELLQKEKRELLKKTRELRQRLSPAISHNYITRYKKQD